MALSTMQAVRDLIVEKGTSMSVAVGLGLGIVTWSLWKLKNRRQDLPPGPRGLPLIGNFLDISKNLHLDFVRLGEIYGDVFSLYAGQKLLVVLNSYEAVHEAFIQRPGDFSDRPEEFDDLMQLHDEIFTPQYNETWRKDKKFILGALKKFGFSSGAGEETISAHADNIIEYLNKRVGSEIDPRDFIYKATANVIASILFSGHWDYEDPKLNEFIDMTECWAAVNFDEGAAVNLMPNFLGKILLYGVADRITSTANVVREFYMREIREHIATLNPDDPRDFIDAYLLDRGVDNVDFQKMTGTVMILSPDAVDTLGVSLIWVMFFLAYYPEIQRRIQAELDEVVGSSRKVSLSDRLHLHYTDAFLHETLRMRPVFAVNMTRSNPTDITFRGYHIPRNSDIFSNIWGIHYNPKYFADPQEFRPERFLDADGKFCKSDYWMAFSVGKRSCIGEQLARMELFLFTTRLMQMFNFSFPDGEKPEIRPTFAGIVPKPEPFNIVVDTRT